MSKRPFVPIGPTGPQVFGLPVERDIIFTNHRGIFKKRVEKRQRKLIVKLAFLKLFLRRGEKLWLVTTGYSPLSSLAQYVTAFLFVYLKRSLFVFTNFRILHIPTTASYRYRQCLAQIPYSGCQSIALKGGTLTVRYADHGKSENFRAIALPERHKIRALIRERIPASGTSQHLAARTHLCPRCAQPLKTGMHACGNCRLKFKRRSIGSLLAIVLPGGGYFYVRQYLLGSLIAALDLFLLLCSAAAVQDVRSSVPGSMSYLIGFGITTVFLKTIALIHANHMIDEFIPVQSEIAADS